MKKLLLVFALFVTALSYGQITPMNIVEIKGINTTVRDAYTPPTGSYPVIYNTTTGQHQKWDGSSWQPLVAASDENDFLTSVTSLGNVLTFVVSNQTDPTIDLSGLDNYTGAELETKLDAYFGSSAWRTQDGTGTDSQTLSFASPNLSISGGNSVDLSALQDGTGTDDQTAAEVSYANATSGLTASNVQAALDEIEARTDTNDAKVGITPTQASDITTNNAKISYTDAAAVSANTAKVSADGSFSTHSDLTKGTATATSASTLRILADDNTDGTYDVFDWTPPTGGGGGTVDVVSNVASGVILGRSTAGSGDSEELLPASVRTLLNIEDGAAADQSAGEVAVTTTNFNGLLSASDASVQAALETLDDVVISNTAASTTFSTSGTWINSTNVQAAIEELDDAAFPITQTAYDLLTAQEQTERNWLIVDASNSVDGSTVSYDNTSSGLAATDLQAAIDEVEARVDLNDAKVTNTDAQDLTLSGNTLAVSGDPNTDVDISAATAVAANTSKISADGSFSSHSDITKGAAGSSSASTLRVLADHDTDGNYDVFDWTPPSGGGGGTLPISDVAKRSSTSTQSLNGTLTAIPWQTEVIAGSSISWSSSNNTRFTVTEDGVYVVGGVFTTTAPAIQRVQQVIEIRVNGTSLDGIYRSSSYIRNSGFAWDFWALEVSGTPIELSAGDYVEFFIATVNGSTYTTADSGGTNSLVGDKSSAWVYTMGGSKPETIQIACSDLTTDITTGTTKAYFRMPYAATVTDVRVSLLAAGTATGLTVDINEDGTSILSTKLTTDATEKTSETATTAAVISDSALADDAEITIDFDAVPTSGQGVIVTLIVTRT